MSAPPLSSYLTYVLTDAARRTTADVAARLRIEGATVEYWRILRALADGHGHSMGSLSEAVLLNHPTLTKTLDRMASDALIYRRPDPSDRRRVAVYLSTRGRNLLRRLDRRVVEHQAALRKCLGDQELDELIAQLNGLMNALDPRTTEET